MISWMLKGCTQDHEVTKCSIKAVKGGKRNKDDDEVGSNARDNVDEVEARSASLSMDQKLQNLYPDNPNPKRP